MDMMADETLRKIDLSIAYGYSAAGYSMGGANQLMSLFDTVFWLLQHYSIMS